ncbi:hypothetical protein EHP00_2130 [Ecytonucleospora hepatopenaei]|uniref:Uncharacterized protein n=1 Tax=Ecytonucleospora hepatopenaei TaxID=646526 RepID=A0A1W0E3N1_9MICR|nr:hypothetical protein EHP00_2130 [Ecytonucleospora hepatopenaei]
MYIWFYATLKQTTLACFCSLCYQDPTVGVTIPSTPAIALLSGFYLPSTLHFTCMHEINKNFTHAGGLNI